MKKLLLAALILCTPHIHTDPVVVPNWSLYVCSLTSALAGISETLDNDKTLFTTELEKLTGTVELFDTVEKSMTATLACISTTFDTLKTEKTTCENEINSLSTAHNTQELLKKGELLALKESTQNQINSLISQRNDVLAYKTNLEQTYATAVAGHDDLARTFIKHAQDTAAKYDAMIISKEALLKKIQDLQERIDAHSQTTIATLSNACTTH